VQPVQAAGCCYWHDDHDVLARSRSG
jgi:hypothetical protein